MFESNLTRSTSRLLILCSTQTSFNNQYKLLSHGEIAPRRQGRKTGDRHSRQGGGNFKRRAGEDHLFRQRLSQFRLLIPCFLVSERSTKLDSIIYPQILQKYIFSNMQALQNLKEDNDERFDTIDKRWGQVQEALRIQQNQRQEDVSLLRERLQDRASISDTLEKNKAKTLKESLDGLLKEANASKENLEQCFEYEAEFRLRHLEKKNAFIQAYNQSGEEFAERIDDYQKTKVREIGNRLETIDQVNREETNETVRFVKEERIGEARTFFDQERTRFTDLLSKTRSDATREIDHLRLSLKDYAKKKEESESKLQIMIASLGAELSKLQEVEWKEGEITYDCLLKVVEDACAKIQQSQYK